MPKIEDDILTYLEFSVCRDAEKGGSGWRSTSEVVEHLGRSRAAVGRRLEKMYEADTIESAQTIDKGGTLWRARRSA